MNASKTIGIVGCGTMGTGIAINFLNAGIPVHLLELGQEALERGVARVRGIAGGRPGGLHLRCPWT